MSSSYRVINPEELGAPSGWNNGMLAAPGGSVLFIAGQTARGASGRVERSALSSSSAAPSTTSWWYCAMLEARRSMSGG